MLSMLFALSLLTVACSQTTRGTATRSLLPSAERKALERNARCAGWRGIEYSAKADTPETVASIRVHNETGRRKGCRRFVRPPAGKGGVS
jgi:hypothetical protein